MAAAQIVDKVDNIEQGASTGLPNGQESKQAIASVELDNSPDKKTIKLSGPLSLIYSQALMQVYGQEDASSQTMAAVMSESVSEPNSYEITTEPNYQGVDGVFVYALDESDLKEQQGFAIACESIFNAGLKYKNVVVAVECYNYATAKRVGIVEDTAKSIGAKVFFKRSTALAYIKNS